jgi:pimeloyl-ACP methyl ester carboxylesterase
MAAGEDAPARASGSPNRRPGRTMRRVAAGAGIVAAGMAAAYLAQRQAARRLRRRPDPEAAVRLEELPPEDLGPVRSFDGTSLAVRGTGPPGGPTLVFLHGITLDMTTWHYQWTAFGDRYRCVLYDHRAHGRSGRPPTGDYSLEALGRDLRAVLDAVVPSGPAILIGHSMGAMTILSFARNHPEEFGDRIAGVILSDTAASDILRELFGGLGQRVGDVLRRVGDRYRSRPELADRLQARLRRFGRDLTLLTAWTTNFGPDAVPSHVAHVTRIAQEVPAEVYLLTLRDILEMDLRTSLELIRVPALVVVGDRDLLTPKTSAQAMRAALPDARAVAITRAGHVAMLEQHAVWNQVAEEFFQEALAPRPARRGRRRRAAT